MPNISNRLKLYKPDIMSYQINDKNKLIKTTKYLFGNWVFSYRHYRAVSQIEKKTQDIFGKNKKWSSLKQLPSKGSTWSKNYHRLMAIVTFIPVVGHIAALAESYFHRNEQKIAKTAKEAEKKPNKKPVPSIPHSKPGKEPKIKKATPIATAEHIGKVFEEIKGQQEFNEKEILSKIKKLPKEFQEIAALCALNPGIKFSELVFSKKEIIFKKDGKKHYADFSKMQNHYIFSDKVKPSFLKTEDAKSYIHSLKKFIGKSENKKFKEASNQLLNETALKDFAIKYLEPIRLQENFEPEIILTQIKALPKELQTCAAFSLFGSVNKLKKDFEFEIKGIKINATFAGDQPDNSIGDHLYSSKIEQNMAKKPTKKVEAFLENLLKIVEESSLKGNKKTLLVLMGKSRHLKTHKFKKLELPLVKNKNRENKKLLTSEVKKNLEALMRDRIAESSKASASNQPAFGLSTHEVLEILDEKSNKESADAFFPYLFQVINNLQIKRFPIRKEEGRIKLAEDIFDKTFFIQPEVCKATQQQLKHSKQGKLISEKISKVLKDHLNDIPKTQIPRIQNEWKALTSNLLEMSNEEEQEAVAQILNENKKLLTEKIKDLKPTKSQRQFDLGKRIISNSNIIENMKKQMEVPPPAIPGFASFNREQDIGKGLKENIQKFRIKLATDKLLPKKIGEEIATLLFKIGGEKDEFFLPLLLSLLDGQSDKQEIQWTDQKQVHFFEFDPSVHGIPIKEKETFKEEMRLLFHTNDLDSFKKEFSELKNALLETINTLIKNEEIQNQCQTIIQDWENIYYLKNLHEEDFYEFKKRSFEEVSQTLKNQKNHIISSLTVNQLIQFLNNVELSLGENDQDFYQEIYEAIETKAQELQNGGAEFPFEKDLFKDIREMSQELNQALSQDATAVYNLVNIEANPMKVFFYLNSVFKDFNFICIRLENSLNHLPIPNFIEYPIDENLQNEVLEEIEKKYGSFEAFIKLKFEETPNAFSELENRYLDVDNNQSIGDYFFEILDPQEVEEEEEVEEIEEEEILEQAVPEQAAQEEASSKKELENPEIASQIQEIKEISQELLELITDEEINIRTVEIEMIERANLINLNVLNNFYNSFKELQITSNEGNNKELNHYLDDLVTLIEDLKSSLIVQRFGWPQINDFETKFAQLKKLKTQNFTLYDFVSDLFLEHQHLTVESKNLKLKKIREMFLFLTDSKAEISDDDLDKKLEELLDNYHLNDLDESEEFKQLLLEDALPLLNEYRNLYFNS